MTGLDEYQQAALRFMSRRRDDPEGRIELADYGLGVAGEAGEVADLIKKRIGHDHPVNNAYLEKLVKEIGDVLWYLAAVAERHGVRLSTIAECNIKKLDERYPNGFNTADSIERRDVHE